MELDVRMTENNRLAMAAAAMVQRMMMRKRLRVFFPVSPRRKGSNGVSIKAIVSPYDRMEGR